MSVAAFSLAEVTYAVGGEIGYQVQESAKSARFRLTTKQDNVSGVLLPRYESYISDSNSDFGLTGLGKGGQQVQKCRETYARAVEALVELATLQVRPQVPSKHPAMVTGMLNCLISSNYRLHLLCLMTLSKW